MAMRPDEYRSYDALGLAALVKKGEVHPGELLEVALGQADALNPRLNAIVYRLDDRARDKAANAGHAAGPFAGVPFLIKDLMQELAGEPCSSGSRPLKNYRATTTADVTRRWEQAGLVIFGLTNTPEFGSMNVTEPGAHGPTRNPWDTSRTPGGSSGGSAAAVAAGIVPMAGASDGGGSIRIPAAVTGLFGLKPGRGKVPSGPAMAEALFGASLNGIVGRSVRDSAAMLDLLQGPEPHGPYNIPVPERSYLEAITQAPKGLKIGWSTASPLGTPVDPQVRLAVEQTAKLLADLGHEVEEAAPEVNGLEMADDFLIPWYSYVARAVEMIRENTGARAGDFDPETRAMAAIGRSVSAVELMRAHEGWHRHTLALTRFHQRYDLWLCPVVSAPALKIGEQAAPDWLIRLNDVTSAVRLSGLVRKTSVFREEVIRNLSWTPFTQLANLTGRPAMSVPLHWTPDGLPLGVQFVGPLNGEEMLLRLAAQLEKARPWFNRVPAMD